MAKLGTEKNPIILRVQNENRANEVASICHKHGWKFILGIEADKPENISDLERLLNPPKPRIKSSDIGRNDPCPCGSGKKYKKCCFIKEDADSKTVENQKDIPRCGLCGKTTNITKTECCDQWICDDESDYKLFSFEHNSCYRNHSRYTLCGYHYANEHGGNWKNCKQCKKAYDTELYVYFGTNEYNFERLENPPKFKLKICKKCGATIRRGFEGYSGNGKDFWCEKCTNEQMSIFMSNKLK